MRSVTRIVDHDTYEFEMYGNDRSGNEEKGMLSFYFNWFGAFAFAGVAS